MKIEKAIEILELNIKEAGKQMPPDCKNAVKLGIEAGKRVILYRKGMYAGLGDLLPGETDDNGRR